MSLPPDRARQRWLDLGVPPNVVKRQLAWEHNQRLLQAHQAGLSYKAIGRLAGLDAGAAWHRVRRAKRTPPPVAAYFRERLAFVGRERSRLRAMVFPKPAPKPRGRPRKVELLEDA